MNPVPIYESILLLKPTLSDGEVADVLAKLKKSVGGEGGDVTSAEVWGRRKLAHPIGRAREGVYVYLKYKAAAAAQTKLKQALVLNDAVLRDLTMVARERKVAPEKKAQAETPRAEPSRDAAAQAT